MIVIFILIIVFLVYGFDMPEDNEIYIEQIILLKIKQKMFCLKEGNSCDNRSIKNSCFINRSEDSQTIYILEDSSLRTLSNAMYEIHILINIT